MDDDTNGPRLNRRQMLSIGAATGVAAGIGVASSPGARAQGGSLPRVEIARLADLKPGDQIDFSYPDEDSPAVLLAFEVPVEDGIGPNENIVAFSILCTHKGCPVSWNADHQMLICPCHWSSFDPAKNGRLVIGQASSSLPQITLKIEAGSVVATGVNGLIYGRQTNVL